MPGVAWVTGSVENIPRSRTTLYQMFMPTYLSSDVFAPLEIGILTSTNHGGQLARLPVSYASSLRFSTVQTLLCALFCNRLYHNLVQVYMEFFLHTQANIRN